MLLLAVSLNLAAPISLLSLGNVLCSTANFLTAEANRISVMLNTSGVTEAITLDISNVF